MLPLTFAPFVGASYKEQEFKILTLGDSHYFGEEDMALFHKDRTNPKIRNVTQSSIRQYFDYKRGEGKFYYHMNTFTKYANALGNRKLSKEEQISIWETTAFYNFSQAPMIGPRAEPTPEDLENFKQSISAFEEVLQDLDPCVVIIWGPRPWENFKKNNCSKENGISYLECNGKKYPFLVIPHPSWENFKPEVQGEKIDRYIQKIKDIKVKKDDKENKINALIQNDPKGTSGKISPIRVNGRMLPLLLLLLLLCVGGIWWFYPFSNSKKAVGNTIVKDSVKPQVDTATTVELKENEIMPMSVFFDFNSATILGDGKELLDEYAKVYLQTNKKAKIVISGYTCDLGSDEINMSVANQRVLEVKKNLVAAGISEENIITHSYGKSKYGEFSYPDRKDYRRVILSIDK